MSNFIRSSSCHRSSQCSRPFVISVLGVRSAKRVLHKISTIQHPTKSTAMTNVNRILNYPRIWLAGEERTQQRTYRGLHLHDLEPSVELGHKVRGTRKCYSAGLSPWQGWDGRHVLEGRRELETTAHYQLRAVLGCSAGGRNCVPCSAWFDQHHMY